MELVHLCIWQVYSKHVSYWTPEYLLVLCSIGVKIRWYIPKGKTEYLLPALHSILLIWSQVFFISDAGENLEKLHCFL